MGLVLSVPGLAKDKTTFNFTPIDFPESTETQANGNSPNEIGGEYVDAKGGRHGFLLSKGVYTTIDKPDASSTTINGVAANKRFTGNYTDSTTHAYFYSKGVFTPLDPPNSRLSEAGSLNAQGEVVGGYRDINSNRRYAFLWSKGAFTPIGPPNDHPAFGPKAWGINDPGQIVGTYVTCGDPCDHTTNARHGFLLSKGVYTTIDVPGADRHTVAEGINNAGQIVGFYLKATDRCPPDYDPITQLPGCGETHGFLLSNGVYTTIDFPGAINYSAVYSINAKGEIVGAYYDGKKVYGYVGTPAP